MKTKINVNDVRTLIFWVQTFLLFEHRKFNHQQLLEKSDYVTNDFVDVEYLHIDELMIDAYDVYNKMKKVSEHADMIDMFNVANLNKDDVIRETEKYFNIFQDFIENYKYDVPEIRGIQQGILNEKMLNCVKVEDYENAAKYRDIIKAS